MAAVALARLVMSLAVAGAADAQVRRLNPPLVFGGDVEAAAVSPDGRWCVYLADQEVNDRRELYAVPIDGRPGGAVKLNAPLSGASFVSQAEITPDGARVVFGVWFTSAMDVRALHGVPIDGSAPSAFLSHAYADYRASTSYALSPDGTRVVVRDVELRSRDVLAQEPPVLLTEVGETVLDSAITADGSRVVFGYEAEDGSRRTYVVPIDGSAPRSLLSGTLHASTFALAPDGDRVLLGPGDPATVDGLYVVPLDGSAPPLELTPPLGAAVELDFADVRMTADTVVYRADQETDGVYELFAVPLAGGPVVKLSPPLVMGGEVEPGIELAPAAGRAVFRADADVDGEVHLYSVPLTGGAVQPLDGPLVAGGHVRPGFRVAPGEGRVVWRADADAAGRIELFSAPLDGSQPRMRLSGVPTAGGDVLDFAASARSGRVVYLADQDTDEQQELYVASLDGSRPPAKISGALTAQGDVVEFHLTPHGERVVYRADAAVNERYELYLVEPAPPMARAGAAAPTRGVSTTVP